MSYCKTQIGDLVTLRQGFAINKKTNHHMSEEPTMLHLLRIGDMKDGNFSIFVRDTIPEKFIANENDIIYTRTGQVGLVFRNQYGVVHNNCFTVTSNDEDVLSQQYLYYALQEESFYEEANSRATGAAQPDLPHGAFNSIEIFLPPVEVQRRITNILDAYNSLIDNNQKQIKLLEEATQRLYKEWFIDLRFPGYEETEIIDGVPKDWEKKLIGDIIGKIPRTKQIKTSDYLSEGAIPVVDQSRDFIAGYTNDKDSVVNLGIPIIVFGDHTRILKYIQFPFAKGADGTQLIISDKDNMPQSLLYLSLKAVDLSNYHYARHFKYLKAEIILVPTQEIGDKFDRIVSPMLNRIQKLRDICNKSSQARDRLLPKLLSGKIEV